MEFLHLSYIRGGLWRFQHLKLFCRRLIDETHSPFPKGTFCRRNYNTNNSPFPKGTSCRRNYNTNNSPYPKGISYKSRKKKPKSTCVLEKTIIFAPNFL